jgi:hypothetical protein
MENARIKTRKEKPMKKREQILSYPLAIYENKKNIAKTLIFAKRIANEYLQGSTRGQAIFSFFMCYQNCSISSS